MTEHLPFGAVAEAYARHRPGYPAAAVAWALEPTSGRDLLDLGAGTGKLTEALLRVPGARVTAVEPDPPMLAELTARHPDVDARLGGAEAIPLPAGSVDAVLVGQAWHWFDHERALPEIARVLRPGGVLATLANGEDPAVEWVAGYRAAVGWEQRAPTGSGGSMAFPEHPAFAKSETADFPNPILTTVDGFVAWLGTHSWVLRAEPEEQPQMIGAVRRYLTTHPETKDEFELPLVTAVLRAVRAH
jgi:SAM-dependent methyltransferase